MAQHKNPKRYKYEIKPIVGKSTVKVIRYTMEYTKKSINSDAPNEIAIDKSTVLTDVTTEKAEEYVFLKTYKGKL